MNVVDSSGWLEYFADGPNAGFFAEPLADVDALVVPAISIYEVFKRLNQQCGESVALEAVALMQQGGQVELDGDLAISAARLSLEWKLPMADSLILAAAQLHHATLWTEDADFSGIENVRYVVKSSM